MEDEDREKKGKRHPSLPPNYVTIVQLRERCLQEKGRKQREKEREDEEERQRKLQLLKELEEKEAEQKQKLGRRGLKGGSGVDIKPVRWKRKPNSPKNRRVVDVSPAKPEESEVAAAARDTGNISAGQEQKGEEPKEEKKRSRPWKNKKKKEETKPAVEEKEQEKEAETKPAGEEEQEKKDMTEATVSAKLVIRAKENAPAKRDGGSKRTMSELKPKRENGDGAAEIELSFGHLSVNSEIERLTARADIHFRGPKTGGNGGNRQYRGHRTISDRWVWVRKGELSEGNVHAVQTFQ